MQISIGSVDHQYIINSNKYQLLIELRFSSLSIQVCKLVINLYIFPGRNVNSEIAKHTTNSIYPTCCVCIADHQIVFTFVFVYTFAFSCEL